MSKFQIAIRKFSVYFAKPIWSFIVNCVFWLGHLNKIGEFRKIKADIKSLSIETLMERFVWVEDKAGDWTPWVMTIICQSFKDDCDAPSAANAYFGFRACKAL
jgi:hypothetical protein